MTYRNSTFAEATRAFSRRAKCERAFRRWTAQLTKLSLTAQRFLKTCFSTAADASVVLQLAFRRRLLEGASKRSFKTLAHKASAQTKESPALFSPSRVEQRKYVIAHSSERNAKNRLQHHIHHFIVKKRVRPRSVPTACVFSHGTTRAGHRSSGLRVQHRRLSDDAHAEANSRRQEG